MTTWRLLVMTVTLCCLLLGCGRRPAPTADAHRADWPTEDWKTATPESQGFDSERLAMALILIKEKRLKIHSLLIVRGGHLLLEAYFHPYDGTIPHDVASVTRSITSALTGLAIDKGYIEGIDQPVLQWFPAFAAIEMDARKKDIKVRHLLSMTTGMQCGYEPHEPELFAMIQSADWLEFALALPMVAGPGTEFAYCSPGFHLLAAVIARSTGSSVADFALEHLFMPLGINEVYWPTDSRGLNRGYGDLRMYPRDMAKIGYLYLNGGRWAGKQILSRDWVNRSWRQRVQVGNSDADYGLGWWLVSGEFAGVYEARGRGGQKIVVWPEKNLVLVLTGAGYDMDQLTGRHKRAPVLMTTRRHRPTAACGETARRR